MPLKTDYPVDFGNTVAKRALNSTEGIISSVMVGRSCEQLRHELGLGDLGVGQAVEPPLVGVGQLAVVKS
jgi:hypothetical protein